MRLHSLLLYEVQVRPGPARRWLFCELRDHEGRIGLAEATHGQQHDATIAALRDAFAALRGNEIEPGGVAAALGLAVDQLQQDRCAATAVSALEAALSDLQAQAAGVSLAALLGEARRDRVPLYANINRAMTGDRSPATFADTAAAAVAAGFATIKCAPFDEVQPDMLPAEAIERAAAGLARIAAVRRAIGPHTGLLVDCHSRFSVAAALAIAPALREQGVGWFEEPLDPVTAAPALGEVSLQAGMTMAGAEMAYGVAEFARIATIARLNVVMPDAKHCGGPAEMVRISRRMEAISVRTSPHSPSGPVCQLAGAHACAVMADPLPLEYAWGEVDWRAQILEPTERIEGGALLLPGGTGLGARLNHELLARHGRRLEES